MSQHAPTLRRRDALSLGLGAGAALALPGAARAQQKMDILVAYYGALLNTSVVAVGLEQGFYATPNVVVGDAVSSIGGGTAIRNMIGGGVDYGIVGTSAALAAFKEGVDIRIVHGAIRSMQDLFWVAMPKSGITSIKDLKGKRIGFTKPKSISETMIKWMLERNGLTGQVAMVSLGSVGAGLTALEAGGVDATLILEPLWSARKDRYTVAFTLSELPPIAQMVGVATPKIMKERPAVLRDLIGAWSKSVEFTYQNPDQAGALMSKRFGAQVMPVAVAQSAVKNMIGINYWSRAEIDQPGLEFWLETMRQQGEWDGPIDWAKVVDKSFLPDAVRG